MLAFSRFLFTSSIVSSTLAATFNVKVGADGLTFTPNFVSGAAGDEVVFEFHPKNHTLTQSTLLNPCNPMAGGGDSGFIAVPPETTIFPTKRIKLVDSTTPLWFYCKQGNHCQSGMVFAINPKSPEQMTTYIANAKASQPGVTVPPPASTEPPPPTQTPPPSGTTPPPSGTGKRIEIAVGQGGLKFTPDRATAAVGDTVVFTFMGGNHTVTQSTFADPCNPMAGGADSLFKPAVGLTSNFPTFEFPVTDASKPIWMYCKQGTHCQSGMVFSLNAPATGNTADAFLEKAKASTPGGSGTNTASGGAPSQTDAGGAALSRYSVSGLLVAGVIAGLLL